MKDETDSTVLADSFKELACGAGKIDLLALSMHQMDKTEIPVTHNFSDGIYTRTMHPKAGTVAVGKIHKYDHINIISQGCMDIAAEDGTVTRVNAPFIMEAKAGQCCAAVFYTDTVWTTIHSSTETDLEKLEAHFVTDTRDQYMEWKHDQLLLSEKQQEKM
jgi:hypothetical protein